VACRPQDRLCSGRSSIGLALMNARSDVLVWNCFSLPNVVWGYRCPHWFLVSSSLCCFGRLTGPSGGSLVALFEPLPEQRSVGRISDAQIGFQRGLSFRGRRLSRGHALHPPGINAWTGTLHPNNRSATSPLKVSSNHIGRVVAEGKPPSASKTRSTRRT